MSGNALPTPTIAYARVGAERRRGSGTGAPIRSASILRAIGRAMPGTAIVWLPAAAAAEDVPDRPPPAVTASVRETVDIWDVAAGGVARGMVVLSKFQASATARGDQLGDPDGVLHAQLFRTDGRSLSARAGDIQTASNIEAPPVTRLFEAWAEQRFGRGGAVAVRAGLMDLNADFDPLETAALFINSSHGIGPDISRSGRNGPSIFPVSALGVRGEWRASGRLTLRAAAFDGVPGDPDRPRAFAVARLRRGDGALLIGQADYRLPGDAKVEVGHWRYTSRQASDTVGAARSRDRGVYASLEGPVSGRWSAWARVGAARSAAQPIGGYVGFGAVAKGLPPGREDDLFGVGVAHAAVSPTYRREAGLPRAETTIEASYQAPVARFLTVQPDVQWIRHPAGADGARDALVVGLRLVFTGGAADDPDEAADPTVSPEGRITEERRRARRRAGTP